MQRTAVCFFKLSTESPVSFEKQDVDGKLYVESREFVMQNLGLVYLHAEPRRKLDFVEDVFRRRFAEECDQSSAHELQDLVGSHTDLVHNAMAREIAQNHPTSHWGRKRSASFAAETSTTSSVSLSDMVRLAGGQTEVARLQTTPRIGHTVQNDAIREPQAHFSRISAVSLAAETSWWRLSRRLAPLRIRTWKFLTSKNEAGTPRKQATRIEPYEPFDLSPEAQFPL